MKRRPPQVFAGILALVLLLSLSVYAKWDAKTKAHIVVLAGDDSPPFRDAVEGFQRNLVQQRTDATVEVHFLARDADTTTVVAKSTEKGPDLLFVLGETVTRAAIENSRDLPIIATLIPDAADLVKADHATGVFLQFSVETYLTWIKRLLPRHQTIGVLYDPKINQAAIDEALRVAPQMEMNVYAQTVGMPRELPEGLKAISRNADLLWGLPDRTVLSPQTAKQILLFSFRNRIPMMGISSSWVKAGALYALDRDYGDIGSQCAEMARKVLQGKSPNLIPPTPPRKVAYSVNLKTAGHLKLEIPGEITKGAVLVIP